MKKNVLKSQNCLNQMTCPSLPGRSSKISGLEGASSSATMSSSAIASYPGASGCSSSSAHGVSIVKMESKDDKIGDRN